MRHGSTRDLFRMIGASNHTKYERAQNDYYSTDPKALESLLRFETFNHNVWEPACGGGALSEVLKSHGYNVLSTDLIDRGYGIGNIDFLTDDVRGVIGDGQFDGDILTNPPYTCDLSFVKRALELVPEGHKVTMLLKLSFLEGQKRQKFYKTAPPKYVYVAVRRTKCFKNGEVIDTQAGAMAFAWFIWEKGFTGEPTIRWFND